MQIYVNCNIHTQTSFDTLILKRGKIGVVVRLAKWHLLWPCQLLESWDTRCGSLLASVKPAHNLNACVYVFMFRTPDFTLWLAKICERQPLAGSACQRGSSFPEAELMSPSGQDQLLQISLLSFETFTRRRRWSPDFHGADSLALRLITREYLSGFVENCQS